VSDCELLEVTGLTRDTRKGRETEVILEAGDYRRSFRISGGDRKAHARFSSLVGMWFTNALGLHDYQPAHVDPEDEDAVLWAADGSRLDSVKDMVARAAAECGLEVV